VCVCDVMCVFYNMNPWISLHLLSPEFSTTTGFSIMTLSINLLVCHR
jgi:hypothetical protein